MSNAKKFGAVVVGLGIAGKVRVRDLKTVTNMFELKGVVSRRPCEIEDVAVFSLEEALKSHEVDTVMVCTEPALHEDYIRQALQNGKHVLVDYPLALSSKVAGELYELAEKNGLVLYEENIALLTESFLALKAKAETTGLMSGSYSLKGSYNGWLEKFDQSGLPFVSGVSCLQVLLSAFGDLTVKSGNLDQSDTGYTATATVVTKDGANIDMILSRSQSKDARREKTSVFDFEDGEIIDGNSIPQSTSKPRLFMQDLENFYKVLTAGKVSDQQKQLVIKSLELAESIHSIF